MPHAIVNLLDYIEEKHNISLKIYNNKSLLLDLPPPFTSGKLHMGHVYQYSLIKLVQIFQKSLKTKIISRFGFDCHGLPTVLKVAKLNKLAIITSNKDQIIRLSSEYTEECIKSMKPSIELLGFDISNHYRTSNADYQKLIKNYIDFLKINNFTSESSRLSFFCPSCRTCLSKSEISTEPIKTIEYYIEITIDKRLYQIMTTKPYLLPYARAIAIHPHNPLAKTIKHSFIKLPFCSEAVPVILDDSINIDKGTGIQFISAIGSITDYDLLKKHRIPIKPYLDENGLFINSNHASFEKKSLLSIKNQIASILKDNKVKFYTKQSSTLRTLHTDRSSCCTEIEYIESPQTVIILTPNQKEKLLSALDAIDCRSSNNATSQLINWIQSFDEWCISRQYYFGSPLDKLNVCDGWLDSSLTLPYLLNSLEQSPDYVWRIQGYDIVRTWLFYSLFTSVIYKTRFLDKLILTKMVVGTDGKKLSKSSLNFDADLDSIMSTYSIEIIRMWAMSSSKNKNIKFNPIELEKYSKFFNKVKNVVRYVENIISNTETEVDRIIEDYSVYLLGHCIDAFTKLEYSRVIFIINNFYTNDLSKILLARNKNYPIENRIKGIKAAISYVDYILDIIKGKEVDLTNISIRPPSLQCVERYRELLTAINSS